MYQLRDNKKKMAAEYWHLRFTSAVSITLLLAKFQWSLLQLNYRGDVPFLSLPESQVVYFLRVCDNLIFLLSRVNILDGLITVNKTLPLKLTFLLGIELMEGLLTD